MASSMTVAGIREMVAGFAGEMERIHKEMQDAEAVAAMLGLAVPWLPAEKPNSRRGGYAAHKDAREFLTGLIEGKPGEKPFTALELTRAANVAMAAEGRPAYTKAAIQQWLRTFERESLVLRLENGEWDRVDA